ncbi:50S ribosomal protein L21 [Clostridia bacterium]|nr:50S ribosomal protein L21 [Clostridia bacterium]
MYAIIATGGKQYKVAEGEVIYVEKLDKSEGETVVFDSVLAISKDTMQVGSPFIPQASVTAKVVEQGRGKKIVVYKYKRKSGYHKKTGHRQSYTKLKIESIKA